jgi:hypothetical protein
MDRIEGRSRYPQERRYRRFSLRYPVHGRFHSSESDFEFEAVSDNVSLGGVLLETASPIPQHGDVSFVLTIPEHRVVGPIQLAGEGEVVRVEPHRSGSGFAVAVKCRNSLSKLQEYLGASAN